jgi:hypothetical protein
MWEHGLAPGDVMRKTATSQDHAALGVDAKQASFAFDDGAAHRAVLDDQLADRGR